MIPAIKVIHGIAPIAGSSARSGDWVCLRNYNHLTILVYIAQGNAATTAITIDKAKTAAGGSNSDGITAGKVYLAAGDLTTTDAFVAVTTAASYTSSAAGTGQSIYRIELDAADIGDDYDFVQVELGSSNASNIVAAVYILSEPRYPGDVDADMTAIS
jgi:hypothetical protein